MVSAELDRVVKIYVFIKSLVILLQVLISFSQKLISLVMDWVTILSGDGREVVNFYRSWVPQSFIEV